MQEGKREGSIVASQTPESILQDEQLIWKNIQAELEDVGISVTAFEANRAFILEWLKDALRKGAFEEKPTQGGKLPRKTSLETFLGDQTNIEVGSLHHSPIPDPAMDPNFESADGAGAESIVLPSVERLRGQRNYVGFRRALEDGNHNKGSQTTKTHL